MFNKRSKNILTLLLLVFFVVSLTASVASAGKVVSLPALQQAAKLDPDRTQGGTTPVAFESVKVVETALVKAGYLADNSYAKDGSYGTATIEAYKKWQKHLGSSPKYCDGIPGTKDLTKLGSLTTLDNEYKFTVDTSLPKTESNYIPVKEGRIIKYGFWQAGKSNYQPDWSALTHVAYFACDVKSDGKVTSVPQIKNYNTVKNSAHKNGVKVIITIRCFDRSVQDSILAKHKDEFATNVLNIIEKNGADGVNLDFEAPLSTNSITGESNTVLFEDLMKNLNAELKSANPNYHISFDVMGSVENIYRNARLKQYTDSVFLMGYDYQNGQKTTGPNSPYNDPTRLDVVDSVKTLSKYYDTKQIILGVPFYGWDWHAVSNQPGSSLKDNKKKPVIMSVAINKAQEYGRNWDLNSKTPYYVYKSGNTWHQVWYDDSQSLGLKFDYAKSANLGGIGFWALGYEGNNANIWNTVKKV